MLNQVIVPRRLPVPSGKVVTSVLALALVGSGVGAYEIHQARATTAVSYTTSSAQTGTITNAVTATGPVSAASAVPLNFKSSGKLASINVKVGDQVKAGDVLATLDTTDLQSQLQQAQATLASAQANYNKVTAGATPQAIAAAKAQV